MADIILGRDVHTNHKVKMAQDQRTTGMLVLGKTGSGKSTFLEHSLIDQDLQEGRSFCLIEPHGDLVNATINRCLREEMDNKKIILFNPFDEEVPGLNLFSCIDPTNPIYIQHTVNQVKQVFIKLFGMSAETPRLSRYIRHITFTMIANPGYTLCDVPNLLLDKEFRQRLVMNTTGTTRLFWKTYDAMSLRDQIAECESTLNRIEGLVTDPILRPIVGQSETTINFREVMDSGKILLVKLNAQQERLTSLIGSIVISQLLLAALSRIDTDPKKRKPFGLIVDEFQRFSTPDMGTLLVEARKFSIYSVVAHQVRDQLDEENKARTLQAGSLVFFALTSKDAEELSAEFDVTPPKAVKPEGTTPADILNHLTDHPSEEVKRFWTVFVKKLLEAKTLKMETPLSRYFNVNEEKPYPYFLIEDKKIYFDPEYGRQLLDYLQPLFYNNSIHKPGNGEMFQEALILSVMMVKGNILLNEKWFLDYFSDMLKAALYAVYLQPIEVPTTEWQTTPTVQQTFPDRKAQVANELTHLDRGVAKIRIPTGEYTMKVTRRDVGWQSFKTKEEAIIQQTRVLYCKSREEVERQIHKRQEQPNPPIVKKHTV